MIRFARLAAILTGAALAVTSCALPVLPPAAAPLIIPGVQNAEAVPAVPWEPGSSQPQALTTSDAPGTKATVLGPSTSVLPGTTQQKDGLTIRNASLPMAPPAANDKGAGDFSALPGVTSGSWGTTGQTGGFTWTYPISARQGPAGPAPEVGLSYDSTQVDGMTSATNNQASAVGDGWGLSGSGRISQRFQSCMDQGITGSYDLCGNAGGQDVSISFGSRSGQLVKDAANPTGPWKLSNDDGSRVEYLTAPGANGTHDGGYWKITDTSGTQYFFGLNKLPGWSAGKASTNSVDTVPVGAANSGQPCAAASFAASLCQQALSWNLDYVVDVHGNTQAQYYSQAINHYRAQAGNGAILPYIRSSRLDRIDYGMRSGNELSVSAPLRIKFDYTDRCSGIDCAAGTDVPADLACTAAGPCTIQSPTFYIDHRLTGIQTESLVGGAYQAADRWNLTHSMPNPGDGTKPALWLGSVEHKGLNTQAGQPVITDPPVVFGGQTLQNRVWVMDGLAPLNRFRLSTIKTVTGATIAIAYNGADCSPTSLPASPETNARRCFPQWWQPTTPIVQASRMDWFHIYPVAAVTVDAGPGGAGSVSQTTRYQYIGTPAWKYPEPSYRTGTAGAKQTWSVAAGWAQVKTLTAGGTTVTTYLRGLDKTPSNSSGGRNASQMTASDGTIITDSIWFAGRTLETQELVSENGAVLRTSLSVPWASEATATGAATLGSPTARRQGTSRNWTRSAIDTGWRTTESKTYFEDGRPKAVTHALDLGTAADDTCTTTSYADGTAANLLTLPASISTYAGACNSTTGAPTGNILKSTETFYDNNTSAVPGTSGYAQPTKGSITGTRLAKAVAGTAVTGWQPGPTLAYDALGRLSASTDNTTGAPRTTTTAYSPATGPATTVTITNPKTPDPWTKTSTLDPVRGQEISSVDPNGSTVTTEYDASGRTTGVWDPSRPKATNALPTTGTTYKVSQTEPSWVRTDTTNYRDSPGSTYKIYDGLGRLRQTHSQSVQNGTITTDTLYNAAGAKALERHPYYLSTTPDGVLRIPSLAVPSSTEYLYDTAGRLVKTRKLAYDNQEQWTTTLSYAGTNSITTTGPGNDPATTVITDTVGKTVARKTYRGIAATGTADTATYTYDALQQMTRMTDPAGNAWTWTFDPLGRQTIATDPDTGTSTTTYDDSGRPSTLKNALGTIITTEYDILDRAIKVSSTLEGQTAKTLLTHTYDTEKKGQLASSTRFNGPDQDQPVTTTTSGYNANYQPGSVKVQLPAAVGELAGTYETKSTYGKSGLPADVTYPAIGGLPQETVTNAYDDWDQPSGTISPFGVTYAGGARDNMNNLSNYSQWDNKLFSSGNDTMGENMVYFTWDHTTGRLQETKTINDARSVVTDLGTTKYRYEPSGQLTSRELAYSTRPNGAAASDFQCYDYDYAGRLAGVWTPSSKSCTGGFTPTGLGGAAPYAQSYEYNTTGDRSQVKRFNAAGAVATTESYAYPGTPSVPGAFTAKTPFRQLDTRNGTGGVTGPIGAWQTVRVKVTGGQGGIPATGVSAVALNITVTAPTTAGNITAYAGGTPQPSTSNVNFVAGQTTPNSAITPVGADGTVAFTNNSNGTVHLLADTSGYFLAGTPTVAGAFDAKTPFRQLDTRNGTGGVTGPVGAWQTVRVKVTGGQGGIPATGVSAVALNITVTAPTTAGNITAYAGGTPQPSTSNVNFVAGETTPNSAITPVGADGTVSFTNNSNGTVHLLADTSGYFLAGTPTVAGAFDAKTPFRQLDTRNGTGGITGPVGAWQTVRVKVTGGQGGIPATGVSAVALNITVTAPTTAGNITAYAGGTPQPSTSNVNFVAGETTPNSAITPVGADGTVSFTNNSNGTVHLLADTSGYFLPPITSGLPGPHRLQSLTSTPASGTATTSTFTWDAAGRMTNRAGQAIAYTPDGKIASTTGTSTVSRNANPAAATGTTPVAGTATVSQRYYTADGTLVATKDGTGTTITLGNATAFCTPDGKISATRTYTFAGKTVAQRTSRPGITGTAVAFINGDSVNTAQIMTGPTTSGGTVGITAVKRHTDPSGLTRGPTLTSIGQAAFASAPAAKTGPGSNESNDTGFSAATGYIAGTNDTASALTHLGARDYDPALGTFTAPDPILKLDEAKNFSPYLYAEGDPVNDSDPSGLMIVGPMLYDGPDAYATAYPVKARESRWAKAHPMPEFLRPGIAPENQRKRSNPGKWVPSANKPEVYNHLDDCCELGQGYAAGYGDPTIADWNNVGLTPGEGLALGLGTSIGVVVCAGVGVMPCVGTATVACTAKAICKAVGKVAPAAKAEKRLAAGPDWAVSSGILRQAVSGKGNFGLGQATRAVDAQAGKAWVGEGARLASDGRTWLSANGLRQWRPPSMKPRLGKEQSNYEERYEPFGQWQSNGHLDILP